VDEMFDESVLRATRRNNPFDDKFFVLVRENGNLGSGELGLVGVAEAMRGEEEDVKDGVDRKGRREIEEEVEFADLSGDAERSEVFRVELDGGSRVREVLSIEPYEVAGREDGDWVEMVGIGRIESDDVAAGEIIV
jgi:hypothetical protein